MDFCNDHSFYVRVNQVFGNFEFFTEDIKFLVTPNKPNKRNVTVRDIIEHRYLGIGSKLYGLVISLLGNFHWGGTIQATVSMMPIVKPLKIFTLPL
jgi:hypothetical protein